MHIGVILDTEFTTDVRVRNEVHYLVEKGFKISVLCPNYKNYPPFESSKNIAIYRFSFNKTLKNKLFGILNTFPVYDWLWIYQIKKFIRKTGVKALHTHDLYMAKSVFQANKKNRLPIVLDLHENYPQAIYSYVWANKLPFRLLAKPWKWEEKEPSYLKYAQKLVVLSESYKTDLLNRFEFLKEGNICVYPNVPDTQQLTGFEIDTSILNKNPNDFILFYFGGISRRRGIFDCIQALEKLLEVHKNIKLLLIGPIDSAENSEFQEAITRPKVKENIIFYPWKDIKYLPSYIAASDVCLSPIVKNKQHESGVANKIFQYMLFEKPLIVSDCAPQVAIIEKENCGLVFKSEDVNDLAEKIEYLYHHKELLKEMGLNGKNAVIAKYNIEAYGKNLCKLYD